MKPLPNSLEIIHSYVNNGQKIQKVYAMYRKKNTLRRREGLVYYVRKGLREEEFESCRFASLGGYRALIKGKNSRKGVVVGFKR